ncbi:MAG: response regulator [Gammaproteobacteria bacterium]|nr:response regulator [Gammaproteobacteria bacterium]
MNTAFQILLVEDNDIVQRTTRSTFERHGCPVWLAPNAKEAILMSNTQPFSLILMDIGLPDGSGLDVSEHIRSNIHCPNRYTPIIVITAHFSTPDAKQRCTEIGINQVLQKPVYGKQLLQLLDGIEPYAHLPLYDKQKAIDLHRNAAAAEKVLHLYIKELERERDNFDKYYQAEDWDNLRKAAHRQHGAGLYCGTTRLNACLDDMETLLHHHPIQLAHVTTQYQLLQETLQALSDFIMNDKEQQYAS